MDKEENRICRLCLKTTGTYFESIEDNIIETFKILVLEINLLLSEEPVMCKTCGENVRKCFNFKSICTNAEKYFATDNDCSTTDLRDIYLNESKNIDVTTYGVCLFCTKRIGRDRYICFDKLKEDVVFAEEMLPKYFSELAFNVPKTAVICKTCAESLENYLIFVRNCCKVEEKINEYSRIEGTNSKGQVELNRVQQFLFKDMLDIGDPCIKVDIIKMEEAMPSIREFEEFQMKDMKMEDPEVKIKYEVTDRVDNVDSDRFKIDQQTTAAEPQILTCRNTSKVRKYHKCNLCAYETIFKATLKKHLLVHMDASEITMYKCAICTFTTKHKGNLKQHMVIHKDDSEITSHQCEVCGYETVYKQSFRRHMLIHKDVSEVKTYECEICQFSTKYRSCLKQHTLVHKDASYLPMHRCPSCRYKTKNKGDLKRHMLVHKNESEITTYQCEVCDFKTRHKKSVTQHMLIHKDASEVTMYECETCDYKSKHKSNVKKHMQIHKAGKNAVCIIK